jgi:Planctomycete cytochrome C
MKCGRLWSFDALLASFVAAGCGGGDNRPARWSVIAPAIIEPSCATVSCHSAVTARAGVTLEPGDVSFHTVVDRHFVIPGRPDLSEMVALMRAEGSPRMPPDFALPETDIALIERWITNGAHDD